MVFFITTLLFYALTLLCFLATLYIYIRLVIAVKAGKEVPRWIYQLGQGFQGRIKVNYDDVTDRIALKDVHTFIFILISANILMFSVMYYRTHHFPLALYTCLKAQFAIVIVAMILTKIPKIISVLRQPSTQPDYLYSPTNAVIGGIFMTTFIFTLAFSISGFPEKPIAVQLDESEVIIGETTAGELLADGFSFAQKDPESEIINEHNDHFYYGELVEVFRDGKSYGKMSLTPTWKDADMLKNCTITYYRLPAENNLLDKVKINHTDLSHLSINDFKTKKLVDIFSLTPVTYEENKLDTSFNLEMQTADYSLWKRYTIEINFNADGAISYYGVRAQHDIWA